MNIMIVSFFIMKVIIFSTVHIVYYVLLKEDYMVGVQEIMFVFRERNCLLWVYIFSTLFRQVFVPCSSVSCPCGLQGAVIQSRV